MGYHLPTPTHTVPAIIVNNRPWSNLSPNPCTAPTKSHKLCIWQKWFHRFKNLFFGRFQANKLCFRLSPQSLPTEAGRHHRPSVLRASRFCTHCSASMVEDEFMLFSSVRLDHPSDINITPVLPPKPFLCNPSLPKRITFTRSSLTVQNT